MSDNLVKDTVPVEQQESVTIEMSIQELNVMFAALQELPHKIADPILKKFLNQAQAQLNQ